MISAEQQERERQIVERLKQPRACAAFYAGRCQCGATWQPGEVIFRSPLPRGPRPTCFDCGIQAQEARR